MSWKRRKSRLTWNRYKCANSIKDDKKVHVLLLEIGGKTYMLLSSLLALQKLKDKTFIELSDVLQKHFESKPVVIVQRFNFHRRNQAPGESVTDYVASSAAKPRTASSSAT